MVGDSSRSTFPDIGSVSQYLVRRLSTAVYKWAFKMGYRSELSDRNSLMNNLDSPSSVLFLCHGNICRSPFAAAYFAKIGPPDIRVESAGFHPEGGRSSPENAIDAAAQYDVDLADHSSQCVTNELVAASDVVFLMDVRNYLSWKQSYRDFNANAFFLGSLHSGHRSDFELNDPYGGDVGEFQTVYDDITGCVEQILSIIKDQ